MGGVSMVLFEAAALDFEEVHHALLDIGLSILRQGNILAAWRENSPLLFITSMWGETVRQEAIGIGQDTAYAADLSRCTARIEIAFDDLEEVRAEAETLLEIQETLQDATQGFIFNTWNRKLAPPR